MEMKWKRALPNRALRALILTGDLGDGHRQAARALAEACEGALSMRVQSEITDFMSEVYPHTHDMIRYCFLKGVEKAPSVYGYFYRKTKRSEGVSLFSKPFLAMGLPRLAALLERTKPDLIVCTFPLAAAAVSLLKERGLADAPLVTVITDHSDHGLWLQPQTDLYLVGSDSLAHALRLRGVPQSRLCVTGIPIRLGFSEDADRNRLRGKLGVASDRPLVLVMGGGCGLLGGEIRELLHSAPVRERLQLVVICGSNEAARRKLEDELRRAPSEHIRVLGFVDNVHEWMAAADLLLTKPGGLTTSEAVSMGLPMLLYKPIPGQEEDNAAVLHHAGVAIRASRRALRDQLMELAENGARLRDMREQAKHFRRAKQPALLAWEAILGLPAAAPIPEPGAWQPLAVRQAF